MKLGFGLYRHMLDEQHYRFAKQCGATHIVAHLVDYFGHAKKAKVNSNQPVVEPKVGDQLAMVRYGAFKICWRLKTR